MKETLSPEIQEVVRVLDLEAVRLKGAQTVKAKVRRERVIEAADNWRSGEWGVIEE